MKTNITKPNRFHSVLLFAVITAMSSSCGISTEQSSSLREAASSWKGVLMAGYYNDSSGQTEAWDNATSKIRDLMTSLFSQSSSNFKRYTKDTRKLNTAGVDGDASLQSLTSGLGASSLGTNDGCFVFMTSHGSNDGGFNIENSRSIMPQEFFSALESQCGDRKTVAIVSACFSGHFVDAARSLNKPNMVVLSAANHVPSFGCDANEEFTFYDRCMIETLPNAKSSTYKEFYEQLKVCVTKKEASQGEERSDPQAYFGSALGDEIMFSTSGGSSDQGAGNDSGLYVKASGALNNLSFEVASLADYDRVVLCTAEAADKCTQSISGTISTTTAERNFHKVSGALDLSLHKKLFIFGFKKGNTGNVADVLRSASVTSNI